MFDKKGKIGFIAALYAHTYKRRWLPMRIVLPFMNLLENKASADLEKRRSEYLKSEILSEKEMKNLVVSLTSFPGRIEKVWQTIFSLKLQTFRPEKIILWLSEIEFPSRNLPISLTDLTDSQFEIRFVKENLRSHLKYYHAFKEFSTSYIITVDDDMFYNKNTVKNLVLKSGKYPDAIISNRVRKMRFFEKSLLSYNLWDTRVRVEKDPDLFLLGVDGVLYPPGSMPPLTTRSEKFMELAPLADDVWLNAITRWWGLPIINADFRFRNLPTNKNSVTLEAINCGKNLNDSQIDKVRHFFKEKFDKDIF